MVPTTPLAHGLVRIVVQRASIGLILNKNGYMQFHAANSMRAKDLATPQWASRLNNVLDCNDFDHGPLTRYVKLQVAHAPGMPGTFSPAADFKGNR